MRPARERLIYPLAAVIVTIVVAAFVNFFIRNDDRSFQALLIVGGMVSPVLAYTFGHALLKRSTEEE